ncbi:LamG domain-containing protein, partial [Candidatus Dojkabacteria bacterium]|nr:LamG domain-containing protein [Candidatus Dojkabacteria bacterium]
VVGNDSVFELSNGEGLNGDSTLASLITFGTFNYTGEDTLKIDGADLTIRGNMVLQNNNVQIGGTNAGGLTLYANTWHYNNENRHELGDVHVTPNGVLKLVSYNSGDSDWTNDYGVQLTTNNLTVDEGGVVTSSGFGYGQNRGGGAQGVYGGYAYNESGTPYGSLFEPVDLGSSSGGGAMKLIINETLINNGSILSNGNAETAGSGGSIWIDTDILAGNGIITANAGTNSDYRAINGSGGRVAIYYVTDESGMLSTMGTDAQKIEARSNGCICEWVPYPSGPGTVYIENKGVVEPHQGDLFIHNGGGQGRAMDFDATDYFFNNVYIGKNVKVKMNQNLSAIRSNESISDEENVEDTGDAFAIWTFEEEADGSCSGGGDYCDTSNNNRNLSAVGSERTTGKVGNGLLLTGENYAEVDIPGAWVSSFSVGMWVRLDELTANGSDAEEFINFNNISTTSSFDIDGSGNLRFEWPSKLVTGVEETTNFLPVGEWRHLVATYNGSTGQRRIYINGQLAAQDTADPSYTLEISKISIGKGGLGSSTGLVGAIDEVFIYPRVLTDTELMVYVNTYSWEEYNNKRGRGPVLNLTGDITVDQGALLTAKGLGFPSEEGLGRGIRGSGQSGGAGGGHGGSGGNGESDGGSAGPNGGTFYGNQRRPFTLGSGGGRAGTGAAGGTGGGAIALRARTGNVNIFGTLDVSGTNGLTASPGGGGRAGGSILIEGQTC